MAESSSPSDENKQKLQLGQVMATLRFLWRYWKKTPWIVAVIAFFIPLYGIIESFQPYIAKQLMLSVQGGTPHTAWLMLGVYVGSILCVFLFGQTGNRLLERTSLHLVRRVLSDTFERVSRADTQWHANTFAGATVSKINRGHGAFSDASMELSSAVHVFSLFMALLIVTFFTSPLVAIVMIVAVAFFIVVSVSFAKRYVWPTNREAVEQNDKMNGALADAIGCSATIKSFGAERREVVHLSKVVRFWSRTMSRFWMRRYDMFLFFGVLTMVIFSSIVGTTLYLWQSGRADASDVVYALMLVGIINGYIGQIPGIVHRSMKICNDMDALIKIHEMPQGVKDAPDARVARINRGEIVFRKVDFRYDAQAQKLFDGLDVRIAAGESVGLVGASGSGKSTFVKLLQRLYEVDAGAVEVDGVDVRAVTQSSLRKHIALVPQDPILFHRSLFENIRYGRPEASMAEVEEAARLAYAHDFIAASPQGYDTLVGERGIKLSGGERQRVAIARALLSKAPILVMDEATSSLDSVSELAIQNALDNMMKERTTLIIAHRLSTLRAVDRLLVFDGGKIVEEGTHETLMDLPNGHYRRLYETQSLGLVAGDG